MKHVLGRSILAAALTLLAIAGGGLAAPALAKTEIVWWHAHTGFLGERVMDLVNKFNASQSEYQVVALRKGTYAETLTAAVAAYRAKTPPHIVQVYEVGTQTMLSSGAVYPVYQLMADQGIKVNWDEYLSVVKSYYSKDGKLYSMPFNSSTPVLYYNKTIFKKAGLDPGKAPATFDEIEKAARAVVSSGAAKIGFTVAWPSWTLAENAHAWHDQPFADKENGFADMATRLLINGEFGVKLWSMLARWQKEGLFTYSGRGSKGDQPIKNGDAAIGIASTGVIGSLVKTAKFEWGTGSLPRLAGYPQGNSIIGGATLWVMKGHKPAEYRAVAKFLEFLGQIEQQAWWHAETGYLPISTPALKHLERVGHFRKQPAMWTAFAQITSGRTTPNSQGIRLGDFVAIRAVIEAELENVLAGKKTAQQGLDTAVAKANDILKEFAALYR
jgi:sn-glycerol 3-phosphate transport system substrate-binding protein